MKTTLIYRAVTAALSLSAALDGITVAHANEEIMSCTGDAPGISATACGSGASAKGDFATALGAKSEANALLATALGAESKANHDAATAIGGNAQANGAAANAIGASSKATGDGAIAIGTSAQANSSSANAIGAFSKASGEGAIALGFRAVVQESASNAVALGQLSVADRANSVSIGAKDNERQITNVAAGTNDTDAVNFSQLKQAGLIGRDGSTFSALVYDADSHSRIVTLGGVGALAAPVGLTNVAQGKITPESTDAVNGGQLFELTSRVDVLSDKAGTGGSDSGIDGKGQRVTSAAVSVVDADSAAVGSENPVAATSHKAYALESSVALKADADASNINATARNASVPVAEANGTAIGEGAEVLAGATGAVAVGQDSVADRANTVSVGAVGAERQITNVAAGTADMDAVNVSQLNSAVDTGVQQANAYTNQQVNSLRSEVDGYRKDAYAGSASAIAMANLPQAVLPGERVVSLGGGTFGGQSAMAVGLSTATQKWMVKASLTTNTRGSVGAGAGLGYRW